MERKEILIEKATNSIHEELEFAGWFPEETIVKYFNMIYDIAYNHGNMRRGKKIVMIKDGKIVKEFNTLKEAAQQLGMGITTVHSIVNGTSKFRINEFYLRYL